MSTEHKKNNPVFIEVAVGNTCFKTITKNSIENFVDIVSTNPHIEFKTKVPQFYFLSKKKECENIMCYLFNNTNVLTMNFDGKGNVDLYCFSGTTTNTDIEYDKYTLNVDMKNNKFKLPDLTFTPKGFNSNNINYIKGGRMKREREE